MQNCGKPSFCVSKNAPVKKQEKVHAGNRRAEKTLRYSKKSELDREFGYRSSEDEEGSESRKDYVLARVEPVTKVGNTEEAVRTLNEKAKSAGLSAEYRAAEIKADGRITRELAGAVNAGNFASERERILYGRQAAHGDFTGAKKSHALVQDMVREQIEKNYEAADEIRERLKEENINIVKCRHNYVRINFCFSSRCFFTKAVGCSQDFFQ